LTRDEQRQLAEIFIAKLTESVAKGPFTTYTLRFADSTKSFFNYFKVYRYEIKMDQQVMMMVILAKYGN